MEVSPLKEGVKGQTHGSQDTRKGRAREDMTVSGTGAPQVLNFEAWPMSS